MDRPLNPGRNTALCTLGLNIYDPNNPDQALFLRLWNAIARQIARNRRITSWVQEQLETLRKAGELHAERLTVPGTMAICAGPISKTPAIVDPIAVIWGIPVLPMTAVGLALYYAAQLAPNGL